MIIIVSNRKHTKIGDQIQIRKLFPQKRKAE